MDLGYLKQSTRVEHEATEETVSLMGDDLTRAEYVGVLKRMYGAVRTWDDWAAEHVPAALASLLQGRRRSSLIEADLEHLGVTAPSILKGGDEAFSSYLHADPVERDAAFLGAMYVVEGSTLGGQFIAKHVEETLGFEPGCGDAYFRGYGEQTSAMWKSFKTVLAAVPDSQSELVVHSAKHMFAFFASHMTDTGTNDA